jgi:MtN3 and saliva related transmembrane protein
MPEWLQYVGYIAGAFTTGATIPQVVKTIRTKDAADISKRMYWIYLLGVTLWIVYGIIQKDGAIIITNSASFMLAATMLFLKWKYGDTNNASQSQLASSKK